MRKRIEAAFLMLLLVIGTSFAAYGSSGAQKAADARNAVVRILVNTPDGISLGTGFGVGEFEEDADTFVTNWHVVTDNSGSYADSQVFILLDDETVIEYYWEQVSDGERIDTESGTYAQDENGIWYKLKGKFSLGNAVECEILFAENQYPDIAVLRTEKSVAGVSTLPLKQVGQEAVGQRVYAIGYPGSADLATTSTENPGTIDEIQREKIVGSVESVSLDGGEISRIISMDAFGDTVGIIHHAHINHGNSGGPLVMEDGCAIGINTYGYGEETSTEYSVSIDIAYAMEVLDQLGIAYTSGSLPEASNNKLVMYIAAAAVAFFLFVMAAKIGRKGNGKNTRSQKFPAELCIQGTCGVFSGRYFPVKGELTIGRDSKRCQLIYPGGTKGVSKIHCVIRFRDGKLTVTDCGSTYGTVVNRQRILPHTPTSLLVGDHIFLGSAQEGFQIARKGGES